MYQEINATRVERKKKPEGKATLQAPLLTVIII